MQLAENTLVSSSILVELLNTQEYFTTLQSLVESDGRILTYAHPPHAPIFS